MGSWCGPITCCEEVSTLDVDEIGVAINTKSQLKKCNVSMSINWAETAGWLQKTYFTILYYLRLYPAYSTCIAYADVAIPKQACSCRRCACQRQFSELLSCCRRSPVVSSVVVPLLFECVGRPVGQRHIVVQTKGGVFKHVATDQRFVFCDAIVGSVRLYSKLVARPSLGYQDKRVTIKVSLEQPKKDRHEPEDSSLMIEEYSTMT